ncbi:efflux RND transporter periplasmic adaptor subunit [uncultured Shimia sp.]|uniref:efflux RND transporter periplasmic adaptor subunit n=1 Tax=uncultured Shimia sp. TaxID=573152 RepID=UPI0026122FFF|nr:efflux RND transporter periplasmic adaptor subunit [uncultured Shimia sp.]
MRIVPVLTAILVVAFLFFLVVEREALLAFAGAGPESESTEATSETEVVDAAAETGAATLVRVVAVKSTASAVDSAVILRGQTEADRQVEVRAETSAQVISQPLRRGTHIEAGDVLCQLDPGTREANLAEAQARLSEAKARVPETKARLDEAEARLSEMRITFNAATKLIEGGYASETRVASAKAAVRAAEAGVQSARSGLQTTEAGIQSAEASVAAAEREIERLKITAPFSGLLESDTAELGSLMQPGSLCATVIRLNPIKFVGFVPETAVSQIQPGALAGARLTTGHEVTGQVTFLSRSADETTRTFRVEVVVANDDLKIRDGQTAEIMIAAEGADAHLIPQSSLTLNDEGTLGVRVADENNIVRFSPINLLRDSVDGIWVTGLPPEANVIVIGQEFVVEGVEVELVFQEAEQ